MNAIKEFLKNYAIGYAAGFISTTVLRNNKPQRREERPEQPHEEEDVKAKAKAPKVGQVLEDGTFIE